MENKRQKDWEVVAERVKQNLLNGRDICDGLHYPNLDMPVTAILSGKDRDSEYIMVKPLRFTIDAKTSAKDIKKGDILTLAISEKKCEVVKEGSYDITVTVEGSEHVIHTIGMVFLIGAKVFRDYHK